MASDLQRIVDSLGSRLKRAVAVDDPRLRLQAYSSHYGEVDPVRLASILHREAPAEAARWANDQGIAEATGPVRLPSNPELKMEARLCVPIRVQDWLLGYLVLVDPESSLTSEELEIASAAADEAGIVMYRERLLHELERGREREFLRDLMSDDPQIRGQAAEQLIDTNLFLAGAPVAILVASPASTSDHPNDEAMRMAMDVGFDNVKNGLARKHSLHLGRPDHGLLIVAVGDLRLASTHVPDIAEELRSQLLKSLQSQGVEEVIVGIGETQKDLADAAVSYRQAQAALRVARIVPTFRPIVAWSQLGIYRMLTRFPVEELTSDVLHPGLITLFERRDAPVLVGTLESYLDRGCNAKTTALELGLHRASLYYRLQKIEDLAGVDLSNGEDRLALHLGLKLAKSAGLHPL